MPDLSRFTQNVLRRIIVVGTGLVNVLLLTGFPQDLFGCAAATG
jgi:hypothetical protein